MATARPETVLDQLVGRVQRRLGDYGTPPDKECIRAVLSTLTADEAMRLAAWQTNSNAS